MGLRASDTCVIDLEDVRVPVGNRLGKEGDGFLVAMKPSTAAASASRSRLWASDAPASRLR